MDQKLQEILCDVFRIAPEAYHPELASADVEAWDSVLHITLMLTLEQAFDVSFEPEEAAQLTTVRAIKAALAKKLSPPQC